MKVEFEAHNVELEVGDVIKFNEWTTEEVEEFRLIVKYDDKILAIDPISCKVMFSGEHVSDMIEAYEAKRGFRIIKNKNIKLVLQTSS